MADKLKVFICWSGESSAPVATAFYKWLPVALQGIETFMSVGIEKGRRWSEVIANRLAESEYGIICLTPDNLESPWILFESGALSKNFPTSRVATYLIDGLSPSAIPQPLGGFQHTRAERDDTRELLAALNELLDPSRRVDREMLDHVFEPFWEKVRDALDGTKEAAELAPEPDEREMLIEILEWARAQEKPAIKFLRGAELRWYRDLMTDIDPALHVESVQRCRDVLTFAVAFPDGHVYLMLLDSYGTRAKMRAEIERWLQGLSGWSPPKC